MNAVLAYLGRSGMREQAGSRALCLQPNLVREAVAFDAPLRQPLRFREAMSALHDVVVSDLRFKPKDKSAYNAWKVSEQQRQQRLRTAAFHAVALEKKALHAIPLPPNLQQDFNRLKQKYWSARQAYGSLLMREEMGLWRLLVPFDPVISVAEDIVSFECFSADESSYGRLSVERDGGFGPSDQVQLGTTNVDYSWDLYHYFQSLRSYRETRLQVDPGGFSVATAGREDFHEEKIDLPAGWLEGFLQTQSAMSLPMQKVTLTREAVYSLLAYLRRHKARTSPRAIRFELSPGSAPRLVLEPWEVSIDSHGTRYDGPRCAPIRIWGRQRLQVLARLLPLAERFEVYLLGNGLPSFWVAVMGEMRFTLGLSGWTTNDWTRGSGLHLLRPQVTPSPTAVDEVARTLQTVRQATLTQLSAKLVAQPEVCAAALDHLARAGQVIYDLAAGVYRWRQLMPRAVGEADRSPEHPELVGCQPIVARGNVTLEAQQPLENGLTKYVAKSGGCPVELDLDAEGRIRGGKCVCSYFKTAGLRKGPCRHLLALRWAVQQPARPQPSRN